MKSKKHETLQLSWDYVSEYIESVISSAAGHAVRCEAYVEDEDCWGVKLVGYQMPVGEMQGILEMIHISGDSLKKMQSDNRRHIRVMGTELANEILAAALQCRWEWQMASDALWLVGVTYDITEIQLCGKFYPVHSLKSRQELVDYLMENGPTHSSLMDFCEDYRNQYQNELCWAYPISDGLHLGTFFILVREGIACLPYNDADKVDYELFCMDDIRMLDVESLRNFIQDWQSFSSELWQAMHGMLCYLKKQEVQMQTTEGPCQKGGGSL